MFKRRSHTIPPSLGESVRQKSHLLIVSTIAAHTHTHLLYPYVLPGAISMYSSYLRWPGCRQEFKQGKTTIPLAPVAGRHQCRRRIIFRKVQVCKTEVLPFLPTTVPLSGTCMQYAQTMRAKENIYFRRYPYTTRITMILPWFN